MELKDMTMEDLYKAKSQLLEQHIAIPQQLQVINSEINARATTPQVTPQVTPQEEEEK
jgi:hypothetical protein